MGRIVKTKYIGGRVDQPKFDEVIAYTDAAHFSQGDLVRAAVDEYMLGHPMKAVRLSTAALKNFPGIPLTSKEK